jgi:ribose transport system ATP-binding protein
MVMSDRGSVILALSNVSKTFPGTRALDGVGMQVTAGTVHALVGQNGSGKSTLIKILAGFHPPDAGACALLNGTEFRLGDPAAAHAAGVRFVHQDLGLIETLDSVDNLAMGYGYTTGFAGRIAWRKQRIAAQQALRRFGNDFDVRTPVGRLSAFEKTALAIVRAVQGADSAISLLVLDEPTAAMPRPDVEQLFGLIRRLAVGGTAVLLVSHHIDEVFAIADVVTVLRDGRHVATRDVAATGRSELIELMTGSVVEAIQRREDTPLGTVVLQAAGVGGPVLRDFRLGLRGGEVVGVAGLNGSGRDELCGLLFGGQPRAGTVLVGGKELPGGRPDLSIARGVALVPANRHADGLVLSHTVRENLTLADVTPFWRRGNLSVRAERRSAAEWVDRLFIRTSSTEALVDSLSGGNQQKVVVGKWLRMSPAVMLLDEPTQGVDVGAQAEVHRLVRAAADAGSGVLLCSSDEVELANLCDRVLVLREGRVSCELAGPELTAPTIARMISESLSGGRQLA